MRILSAVSILLVTPLLSFAQNVELKVPARYGIMLNTRTYQQFTPEQTLTATIRAIEANRYDVLVAHLIDDKVTEQKADEKARLLESDAEDDLRLLREKQRSNPAGVTAEEKLPYEPVAFQQIVKAEAKVRAFKAIIEDVQKKFLADVNIVKEMKRFLRDGTFDVTGDTAKVTLRDVKGKAIYFVKVNNRWFIQDRQ